MSAASISPFAHLRGRPWTGPVPISHHAQEQAWLRHGIRPDFVEAAEALLRMARRHRAVLLSDRMPAPVGCTPRQMWLVELCGVPVRCVVEVGPPPVIITVFPKGTAWSASQAAARARKGQAFRKADTARAFRRARFSQIDLEDL